MGVFGAMTARARGEYDRTGVLPKPPKGAEWVWDEQHNGWQLAWKMGHERREG